MKKLLIVLMMIISLYGYVDYFADPIAREVGDLLTVQIIENTTAQSESKASKSKMEAHEASGGPSGALDILPSVGIKYENQNIANGGGKTSKKGFVQTVLTVTVIDKTPTGNLIVEGRKKLNISDEESYVVLSGIVRPQDISRGNRISSDRIADLSIELKGIGKIEQATKPSLIERVFGWLF